MKRSNFFMVSNNIFCFSLNAREIAVYCCLCMHSDNETGTCFPSRKLIAYECGGMSLGSVDKAVMALSHRGLLNVTHQRRRNGGKSTNLYTLAKLIKTEEDAENYLDCGMFSSSSTHVHRIDMK